MFKLGIYSARQLSNGKTYSIFGAKKKVSVTLLDKLDASEMDPEAYAAILFCLNDDRCAFKRTYAERFNEFDDKCIEIIQNTFKTTSLKFHDVAVSSGQTSVDFFKKMRQKYDELSYLASDYDPYLTVLKHGPIRVVVSSSSSIVEILLAPFVFTRNPPDRWFYPINRILFLLTRKFWAEPVVARYAAGKLPKHQIRKINIFYPDAQQLANTDKSFMLGQHDLLEPSQKTYDCIRAMNVLNKGYFSADQMQAVLQNVHESLVDNGLFIFGSNQNAGTQVSGAVYAKSDSGFCQIWVTAKEPYISQHIRTFHKQIS